MRNTNFLKFMFLCCNNYIYPGYPRGGTKIEEIRSGKTHHFELTLSVRGGRYFKLRIFFIAEIER